MHAPKSEYSLSWSEALWLLIATGTIFGALRTIGLAIANLGLGRYVQQGVNLLWTGPLGVSLLVLVGGALVWLLGTFVPSLRRVHVFVFSAVWLAATSLALNVTGIYPASAALFGAGVAAVAMRLAFRNPGVVKRAGRRTAVAGLSVVALGFMGLVVSAPALEAWQVGRGAAARPDSPNVLLIVLDTVRAKSLGAYGNARNTSPFFDSLSASGVRFEHAYSVAPWTTPSHASMLTGRWPTDLGVDWNHTLDDRAPTVAEAMRSAGYLTAGFVGNPGNAGRNSGIARGFTHFEDYPASFWGVLRGSKIGDRIASSAWLRNALGRDSLPDRKRGPQVTEEFLGWLDRQEARPFFVFLNYFDAHHPYEAPPEIAARFDVAGTGANFKEPAHKLDPNDPSADLLLRQYEAAIAYQDEELRHLFAELGQRGRLANTLVVITSDHGEEFAEHGVLRHGNSLYRAALHIPLIMSFPGRIQAGQVVSAPVSLRSVAASLTQVVPGLGSGRFEGPSLFDVMADPAAAEPVFSTVEAVPLQPDSFPVHFGPLHSVLHRGYRYIVNAKGVEELYRLDDPAERTNLVGDPDAQEVLRDLKARLSVILHVDDGQRRP